MEACGREIWGNNGGNREQCKENGRSVQKFEERRQGSCRVTVGSCPNVSSVEHHSTQERISFEISQLVQWASQDR